MQIIPTNSFKKDLKRCKKQGKNLPKLKELLYLLEREQPLPQKNKAHKLVGNYSGKWECHIEPDWLLIYEYQEDSIILIRCGSHSDLFG